MPIVLIEGDRDDNGSKQRKFDFEELKTAYNGRAIRTIGVAKRGANTEAPPFRGTIVIAQNAQVDGSPALLSRIVHCHFTKVGHTTETRILSDQFNSIDVEELAGFLPLALRQEKEILNNIFTKADHYYKAIEKIDDVKDTRIILCHAKVAAMVDSLKFIFPGWNDTWSEQSFNHLCTRAKERQQSLNADHPRVALFWENYDLINERQTGDDRHQYDSGCGERLNHSKDEAEIAINLNHYYQEIEKARLESLATSDLKKLLPGSRRHKFKAVKTVRSAIWRGDGQGKPVYCWVFENKEQVR